MTGKTGVWPVKSAIRPDIVRWPAVICSPAVYTLKFWKYSVNPILNQAIQMLGTWELNYLKCWFKGTLMCFLEGTRLLRFSFIELSMNCNTTLAKPLIYQYTRKTKSPTFPLYKYSQYLHVHGHVSCSLKQWLFIKLPMTALFINMQL